jgi:hypothetical protein
MKLWRTNEKEKVMNMLKKSLFSLLFITAGLHAAAGSLQQNLQVAADQKTVALQMIEAMQGSVNFYQQAQQPLDAAGIKEQQSAWQSAVSLYHRYINDLRGQSKVARPALPNLQNLPNIDALMLQSNQSKALFTRLLDEYIAHLGNVYEKKSNLLRFYRNVYAISSADDQNLSITPNEYLALVQTLENAAAQGDWGTTVNLTLPVIQADGSIVEKNLTLNEIKAAIKEIPLPASYYATALKIAAGVALIGGAAFVAAYLHSYPIGFSEGQLAAQAEANLDTAPASPVDQAQPVEQNAVTNLDGAQPSAPVAVEASNAQPAQTSMWDYFMGRGTGYNADTETIDSESFREDRTRQQAGDDKQADDELRQKKIVAESTAMQAEENTSNPERQERLKQGIDKIEAGREMLRKKTIREQADFNDVMPLAQDNADNSSKQTILSNLFGSSRNQNAMKEASIVANPVQSALTKNNQVPLIDGQTVRDRDSVDNLQAITETQPAVQPDSDSSIMNYNNDRLDLTEAVVDNSPVITDTPVKVAVSSNRRQPDSTKRSKAQADARNAKRFGN